MCHNSLITYYYRLFPKKSYFSKHRNKKTVFNCTDTSYISSQNYQNIDFVLLIKLFVFLKIIIKKCKFQCYLINHLTYYYFLLYKNFSNIFFFFVFSHQICFYIYSLHILFFSSFFSSSLILTQLLLQSCVIKIIAFHCICFTITKIVIYFFWFLIACLFSSLEFSIVILTSDKKVKKNIFDLN